MYKNLVQDLHLHFHYVKLQQHNLYVNVEWSYQFLLSSKHVENIELSYINFMHIAYVRSPTNFGRKILDKCNTYIKFEYMYINYYDILTGIQIKGKKILHI